MAGFAVKSVDYGNPFTMLLDNSAGASGVEPLYIGEAEPGTASSALRWRIKKFTYTAATNNVATIKWASGNDRFDKSWDNRASYTYS